MNPRDAIAELERLGFEFVLLTSGSVNYKHVGIAPLDDADRYRAQKLLDYLAANKPGMISVLERRDADGPGELVEINRIREYLERHGYRVVRRSWPPDEPHPLLIVDRRRSR